MHTELDPFADAQAAPTTPTTPHGSLTARLVELAVLREVVAQRNAKIKTALAAYADAHLADDMKKLEAEKRGVDVLENEIKALAVMAYDAMTPEQKAEKDAKKFVAGIGIQDAPEYRITDRDAAFAWSKASGIGYQPEAFVEADVISAAKKLKTPLPFIEKKDGYKATIASDLTKAMQECAA